MNRLSKFAIVLLAVLAAVPAAALDRVIYNGVDLWTTVSHGRTYADFTADPLPAGFFCSKAEPFAGRINFRGVPVATDVAGGLGRTDTVIQRLDNAVFNKRGVAHTRIQVRALQFESLAPVKTACGLYTAKVTLDGEQPITRMRIIRQNEKGGRFVAPISVNVKISFTPVDRPAAEPLEVRKSLRFPPGTNQVWESVPAQKANRWAGFLLVDTDGDRIPDTYLPGTSNFGVGQMRQNKGCDVSVFVEHDSGGCAHGVC